MCEKDSFIPFIYIGQTWKNDGTRRLHTPFPASVYSEIVLPTLPEKREKKSAGESSCATAFSRTLVKREREEKPDRMIEIPVSWLVCKIPPSGGRKLKENKRERVSYSIRKREQ